MQDDRYIVEKLGEVSANVKHILDSLKENRQALTAIREEGREEREKIREDLTKQIAAQSERLGKVEKFNVKIITIAGLLVPLLMVAVNVIVPKLLALI